IRDRNVTGVQTCALPISRPRHPHGTAARGQAPRALSGHRRGDRGRSGGRAELSRAGVGGRHARRAVGELVLRPPLPFPGPEIPVGVIGRPCPDELVDFAEWVDQVNPEYLGADPEFLRCVHELGMSSLVWTVDEAAGMERAIDAGADGIITNAPDRLVEIVETL